ncbi:hypothetical protein LJB87_01110 [Alistipes sp. OttesenSCG-928-L06]|nr:hypothetical protein [Alistipes sp. OttesenSCG-928-L06]
MTACGGNSSNSNASSNEGAATEATVETPAVEEAPAAGSGMLAEYEVLINKLIDLQAKVQKGDMSIMDEYTKLSQEMTDFATKHADDFANMTEADVQRYNELAMKLANAASAQ